MKLQPKIAIYTRTASHEQNSKAELEVQEAVCLEFISRQFPELASMKGAVIVHQDLGYSAMDLKRPGLIKLLEDLKAHQIKIVVVNDMVRLFRRPTDAQSIHEALAECGVTAFAVNGDVLGKEQSLTEKPEASCR